MAAPATVTLTNFSGVWAIDKERSDTMNAIMKLQNIPWYVQQLARFSSVTSRFRHFTDEQGVVHLDEIYTSGGVTRIEARFVDGAVLPQDVLLWGKVEITARSTKVEDLDDPFLAEGWNEESRKGKLIVSVVENPSGKWETTSVWGFADVDGERKYIRRVRGKKGAEVLHVKLVYSYVSE